MPEKKKKELIIKASSYKVLTLPELKLQIALGVIDPKDRQKLWILAHTYKLDIDAETYIQNVLGIRLKPQRQYTFDPTEQEGKKDENSDE